LGQTRDTSAGTVDGDESLRLFCALRLPDEARERLAAWQRAQLPGGRVVPRESLHVTLAFLGRRPASELPAIKGALREAAAAARPPSLRAVRYRETRSVGMVVLAEAEPRAGSLALDLHGRLEALRVYRPERRPWLPHVTVLRFRERPPRLSPPVPDLGEVCPSDAGLYHSVLRSGGAQYEIVETVALGG
jgi:2'-5' RNA ligase